jgi:hypothetical protein
MLAREVQELGKRADNDKTQRACMQRRALLPCTSLA